MVRFRRKSVWMRPLAIGMLGLYLSASLGILPSPTLISRWFGHAISEPYPCQDHGCGCASAHECWNACCCYTPHQRLAWAIRNGVAPPPSVRYTDEQWIAAANDVEPDSANCSLCVAEIKSDLANGVAHKPSDPDSSQATDTTSSPSFPFPTISARSCKGLTELLAFALPGVPPLAVSALLPPPARVPGFAHPEDESSPTRALEIASPPPRVA